MLSDKEILELNELCNALVDGRINEEQKSRLSVWLSTREDARQFYVRSMGLSASLFSFAGEMQTADPEHAPTTRDNWVQKIIRPVWWQFGALAAAACLVLGLWIEWRQTLSKKTASSTVSPDEYVAQLTGSKECEWAGGNSSVPPGGRLRKGQRLELSKGFAEITFDSGAQVVLQGPASLNVDSAWAASLNRGTLKASIPAEAMGFSISNPTVEVVDLGTEFTMFADASGAATEVLVLKGEVEAQPKTAAQPAPIVLREKESRRFASSGITTVHDSEQKFAQAIRSVRLDHFIPATDYLHWSFDEKQGDVFTADAASGNPFPPADFHLQNASPASLAAAHVLSGRWQHALQFDGQFFAKAALPDISESTPHTVAFWVNVPKDANLANAYAMVAWGMNNKQSGSHPVHIGWNRNPNEGTVGVLRTDYGGGFALGATPLRDGRWHHIAVVLIPGSDPATSMEAKQYVDGRLEGEGRPSPPGSKIFSRLSSATSGAVWLGCRLGIDDVRQERFRGEMDELFVADRALEPWEIVGLMNQNRLPPPEIVSAAK